MSHRLHLELGNESTDAEFPDEEWEVLRAYTDCSLQLAEASAVRSGMNVKLIINGETETNRLRYQWELPSEDRIAVLLHRLRPFVLNKERTNFGKVCNLLKRRIALDSFRDWVRANQDEFVGKRAQEQIKISLDQTILNSEIMLMKWLNAHEYHRDPEKQRELEPLKEWFPDKFTQGVFVFMMFDKARAVMEVGRFIWKLRVASNESVALDLAKLQHTEGVEAQIEEVMPS